MCTTALLYDAVNKYCREPKERQTGATVIYGPAIRVSVVPMDTGIGLLRALESCISVTRESACVCVCVSSKHGIQTRIACHDLLIPAQEIYKNEALQCGSIPMLFFLSLFLHSGECWAGRQVDRSKRSAVSE